MGDLGKQIERVTAAGVLLVACDFDGTLAPIVSRPEDARALPGAVEMLGRIGGLPRTSAAILSGRALADLAELSGRPENVLLVGSHGAEFSDGEGPRLTAEQRSLRDRVVARLEEIASAHHGATVETKPGGAALHYRNVSGAAGEAAAREVLDGPAAWAGAHVRTGKKVVELAVLPADKGSALNRVRKRLGAERAIYIGDDVTDEDAFAAMQPDDLSIKVGNEPSQANARVGEPREVVEALERIYARRAAFLGVSAESLHTHTSDD